MGAERMRFVLQKEEQEADRKTIEAKGRSSSGLSLRASHPHSSSGRASKPLRSSQPPQTQSWSSWATPRLLYQSCSAVTLRHDLFSSSRCRRMVCVDDTSKDIRSHLWPGGGASVQESCGCR